MIEPLVLVARRERHPAHEYCHGHRRGGDDHAGAGIAAGDGTGDCPTTGDAFQAALTKVTNALRQYEQCVSASKGQDKCAAEMQQLDDAHDDFEGRERLQTGLPLNS